MRFGGLVMMAALLAAGCSGGESDAPAGEASPTGSADAIATAPDEALPAGGEATAAQDSPSGALEVKVSNDLYEFGYAYPDAVGAIPGLKAMLDGRLEKARDALAVESRSDRSEAKMGGFPYRPHASDTSWKVVAQVPGWLSLSSTIYTYSGGAHGMSAFDSLLWDKQANAAREPVDLFNRAALRSAIQRPFCDALDREREKRRGEPVRHGADDMFSDCINPLESTLILGSSNRRRFDRIGVLIAPYAAGPYAEGTYEVTLPVTPEVLAAVKPDFRDTFSAGR